MECQRRAPAAHFATLRPLFTTATVKNNKISKRRSKILHLFTKDSVTAYSPRKNKRQKKKTKKRKNKYSLNRQTYNYFAPSFRFSVYASLSRKKMINKRQKADISILFPLFSNQRRWTSPRVYIFLGALSFPSVQERVAGQSRLVLSRSGGDRM